MLLESAKSGSRLNLFVSDTAMLFTLVTPQCIDHAVGSQMVARLTRGVRSLWLTPRKVQSGKTLVLSE